VQSYKKIGTDYTDYTDFFIISIKKYQKSALIREIRAKKFGGMNKMLYLCSRISENPEHLTT
jgi:hypothetical protein